MAAAEAAAEARVRRSILVEAERPVADSAPVSRCSAECVGRGTGWYDGMVAALGEDAAYEIRARNVVAATGSYERVPLVPGADRPGVMAARTVIGLLDRAVTASSRAAGRSSSAAGQELATAGERLARAGASVTRADPNRGPRSAVRGRRRVTGAIDRHRRQDGSASRSTSSSSATGARTSTSSWRPAPPSNDSGDTLVPVLDADGRTTVPSLSVVGSATGRFETRPEPDHAKHGAAHPDAMVCFCEDVRVHEVRAELAAGYTDPELVKRRTGALTGPCQGKQCLQAFACLADTGARPSRPPARHSARSASATSSRRR